MSYYVDENGLDIDRSTWDEKKISESHEAIISLDDEDVTVSKIFKGVKNGALFKTTVSSSDEQSVYSSYKRDHESLFQADNDFNRLVASVTAKENIKSDIDESNNALICFDTNENKHVVCDRKTDEHFHFLTRTESESKFNELVGA